MDVITPAWKIFSSLSSPQIETLDVLIIPSITADEITAFREKLIVFISVLKEVLEKVDKMYVANAVASTTSITIDVESNEITSHLATVSTSTSIQSTSCSTQATEKTMTPEINTTSEKMDVDIDDTMSSSNISNKRETKSTRPEIDAKLVQIKASKAEIERRISAFIERKQHEVDEMNKREFCAVFSITPDGQIEDSCARTDAVFIPRAGCKSHVKVSRVVNAHGPQTVPGYHSNSLPTSQSVRVKSECAEQSLAVEERLHNMEDHLNLHNDSHSSRDFVSRLKTLESRILYLESLSPEYFNMTQALKPKRQRFENSMHMTLNPREVTPQYQSLSVDEIDLKMKLLRDKLLKQPDC